MLIHCPQCHFYRELNISQIPDNAVMATCPRCQTRFRFRNLDSEYVEPSSSSTSHLLQQAESKTFTNPPTNNTSISHPDTEYLKNSSNEYNQQNNYKNVFEKLKKYTLTNQTKQPTDGHLDLIPWEHPEKFDFFSSFYQTIIRVMFNPATFFGNISNATSSLLRPLFFYILVRLFQTLMDGMWFMVSLQALEPSITESSLHDLLSSIAQEMTIPMTLIVTPATLALQLGIYALLFYLMIRFVQPEQTYFHTIFRVIAYSAAPTIVCIIPVIGSLVGSIWFSISCFIGCKYALKLSWTKTALALIPLYLIAMAIGLQGAKQFIHIAG